MKKFFKSFWYWIAVWFVIISFGFRSLSIIRKAKKYVKNNDAYNVNERYKSIHKIIRNVFFIKRIEPSYHGFNHLAKKPTLFICNHKSLIDPMVVFEAIYENEGFPYTSFVYKNDLDQSKLLKSALTLIDCVSLDRDDLRQQFDAYQKQNELIKLGRSICVFVEGTRISGHEFGDYKPGALRIAYQNFTPICPVVIYGTNNLDKQFKKVFDFKIKKVIVVALDILKPLEFVNVKTNIISERLKEWMYSQYNKLLVENEKGNKK